MEFKRVVVTGLGALSPLGNDVPLTWDALINGKSGAGPITAFDTTLFKTKFACEVKGFDVNQYLDRKESRKLDKYAQLGLIAAGEAIRDAGLDGEGINKDRVGVIFSSGIGGLNTMDQEVGYYCQNPEKGPKFNPFFIPKLIADIAAGHISITYGYRGPNFGTVSACASSTNGAICAFDYIRMGKADAIVTGGSEAPITPTGVGGFNSMNALSTRNDSPQTASRPFSASRDGFVMGEGAVCLIFEELEHALARGAKIYAEVIGGGASGDAYHLTSSHPEGLGAILVMKNALQDAGIRPEDVDYINVHGTSTPVGDPSEVKAILKVFGDHTYSMNVSSTKSMTGHMLGAAGAMEAMVCALAVQNGIIPPTINYEEGDNDPDIDYRINFTFNKAQKRDIKIALSNTFGFGGHNACIIVKKFEG
ncbi:MAG: beta-ketoacyl-ACP synthase II [Dysgonamonadaceae bacterium]|jgi:3-oxoacyl-[acyl-carrier-protein] synthase II|nr:beta-ketoacyl-ACP synthase II [Dysgonamonadaceae bacterium]